MKDTSILTSFDLFLFDLLKTNNIPFYLSGSKSLVLRGIGKRLGVGDTDLYIPLKYKKEVDSLFEENGFLKRHEDSFYPDRQSYYFVFPTNDVCIFFQSEENKEYEICEINRTPIKILSAQSVLETKIEVLKIGVVDKDPLTKTANQLSDVLYLAELPLITKSVDVPQKEKRSHTLYGFFNNGVISTEDTEDMVTRYVEKRIEKDFSDVGLMNTKISLRGANVSQIEKDGDNAIIYFGFKDNCLGKYLEFSNKIGDKWNIAPVICEDDDGLQILSFDIEIESDEMFITL